MQLRHYMRLIIHWSWLIILCGMICGGATYIISKRLTPVYEASAYIQVNDVSSAGNSGIFNSQAAAVSYAIEVTGNDVFQEVARAIPSVSVTDLENGVSAAPVDNTQLIQIQADAHGPALAAKVANTVATVFIQQQIAQALDQDKKAAAALSAQLIPAKSNVDSAQAQLTRLESSQAPQSQIQHQTDVLNGYQLNYDALYTSYSQLQLQENLTANSLTIAQYAVPPARPKSPNTLLNTILGTGLGLLLTLAFVFLFDWLDSTIKTTEDVAHLALLEPLGSIPLKPRSRSGSLAADSAVEQAFVTICTSFKAVGAGKRAVLVTGLRSGSGVSLTASHLAIALTRSGFRVLLVDANLSRPTQHLVFNVPDSRGLMSGLDGSDSAQSQPTLQHGWLKRWATSVPNLYLLPVGPQPDSAEPIQMTLRLGAWMERLLQQDRSSSPTWMSSDEVDIIIFDAPALDQGPNTVALAAITDCTVLVIDAGKEQADALQRAQETFQRVGSPIVGVVINRQQAKHRAYFYARQPRQFTTFAESSNSATGAKYPALQKRAYVYSQGFNSIPLQKEASSEDTIRRFAVSVPTIPATPDSATARAFTLPRAGEHIDELSRLNGFRAGENQDEQDR